MRPGARFPAGLAAIDAVPIGRCEVCGADAFRGIASGYDYEIETCGNLWKVVACDHCGHAWLDPRPAATALEVIYPATYYSYNIERRVGSAVMSVKTLLDRRKLRSVLALLDRAPETFCDVGCGDGRYLSVLESLGIPRAGLYGIELGERSIEAVRQRGYQAAVGNIDSFAGFDGVRFDAISMFHVIEHVAEPRRALQKLRTWLRPGGLVIIETPNLDSLDARLFRASYWGGYHFPRHWHFFTPGTLGALLRETGFEVIRTRFVTGHSFWLYSFHHLFKYDQRFGFGWLARRFDPLRAKVSLMLATGFDLARSALGFRTSSMLAVARCASAG